MEDQGNPRQLWVSIDESSTDGSNSYYGFGSLWMLDNRRGEFSALIRRVRERHGLRETGEFKWTKVSAKLLPFYCDLVDEFLAFPMQFHCIIVRRSTVKRHLFDGDLDLAMRAHLFTFLKVKVKQCMERDPNREHRFRVWVDPIYSRYEKAAEALLTIVNNALAQSVGSRVVESILVKDSKECPSIQLCDLLLGAVTCSFNGQTTNPAKLAFVKHVASRLGWQAHGDLKAGTYRSSRKFNIWYLQDGEEREVLARPVTLMAIPPHVKAAL